MTIPTLPGITAETVTTPRLTTRVLFSGEESGIPVLFLHGNASSSTFWEETMLALPAGYRGIAPDQRGYGDADRNARIDATRGLADFSDDIASLLDTLGIEKVHVIGHSLGGSIIFNTLLDYSERILSVTLAASSSPYGFGGSKGPHGELCYADGAGSGGGIVNAEFARLLGTGDRTTDNGPISPRSVMNSSYWKPPFISAREEELLSSLLSEHYGDQAYPGDFVASPNWPNVAPGKFGPINAASPLYAPDFSRLNLLAHKPPVLWIRGADDAIVGDMSLLDFGTLGSMSIVPGWPGADVFPPQPMIGQIRATLEAYQANGGMFEEVVFEECGHSPYIEKPEEFNRLFHAHLSKQ